MTKYTFEPQVGFGPLKFGMQRQQLVDQLGGPTEEIVLADAAPWPDEVQENVKHRLILVYKKKTKEYLEYTLFKDALVSIALHNPTEPLVFDGVDLFSDDRAAVVDHFASAEETFFVNNEDLWFAKSGIIFSIPEYWGDDGDKVVTFRLSSYEEQQFKFSDWEELNDPKDI